LIQQEEGTMLSGITWLIIRRYPLLIFGVPGTLLLLAGLASGVGVVSTSLGGHGLRVGQALISVSLCIAGEMAWHTGVILYALERASDLLAVLGDQTDTK
jgi:hypothetical protein